MNFGTKKSTRFMELGKISSNLFFGVALFEVFGIHTEKEYTSTQDGVERTYYIYKDYEVNGKRKRMYVCTQCLKSGKVKRPSQPVISES